CCADVTVAQLFERTSFGCKARIDSTYIEIAFYSPEIVRIMKYPVGDPVQKQSLAVIKQPEKAAIKITEGDDEIVLSNRVLTVSLNKSSGRLLFRNADGTLLLNEKEQGKFNVFDDAGTKTYSVSQTLFWKKRSRFMDWVFCKTGKCHSGTNK